MSSRRNTTAQVAQHAGISSSVAAMVQRAADIRFLAGRGRWTTRRCRHALMMSPASAGQQGSSCRRALGWPPKLAHRGAPPAPSRDTRDFRQARARGDIGRAMRADRRCRKRDIRPEALPAPLITRSPPQRYRAFSAGRRSARVAPAAEKAPHSHAAGGLSSFSTGAGAACSGARNAQLRKVLMPSSAFTEIFAHMLSVAKAISHRGSHGRYQHRH